MTKLTPRSYWHLFFIFSIVFLHFSSYYLYHLKDDLLNELRVEISSPNSDALEQLKLFRINFREEAYEMLSLSKSTPFASQWTSNKQSVQRLEIHIPLKLEPDITNIRIITGTTNLLLDSAILERIVHENTVTLLVKDRDVNKKSFVPILGRQLNWAGDSAVLRAFAKSAGTSLFISAFFFLLISPVLARSRLLQGVCFRFLRWITKPLDNVSLSCYWKIWGFGGAAFIAICFAILENEVLYFFVQADNYKQFFPVILDGCKWLERGELPTYSALLQMGSPTMTVGTYALTYPLTFTSYLIAKNVLKDPYATLEVFAFIHLMGGFFAGCWLSKLLNIRPSIAVPMTLCFVLSGFQLVAGNYWFYMLPVALWFPLLLVNLVRLQMGAAGWRWVVGTGLCIGFWGHAGNIQMWTYGLCFLGLSTFLLLWAGSIPYKCYRPLSAALLFGVGLCVPLLLPQALLLKEVHRYAEVGYGTLEGLAAMVLPYPFISITTGAATWAIRQGVPYAGELFYSGSFPVIVTWLFGSIALLILFSFRLSTDIYKKFTNQQIWLICGLLAFLVSLGSIAGLWRVLIHIPPFDRFTNPFKFLAFINIFFSLSAACNLERIIRSYDSARILSILLPIATAVVLLHHLPYCRHSDFPIRSNLYSPETKVVETLDSNYRSIGHYGNLSLLYSRPAFGGMDPLVLGTAANQNLKKLFQKDRKKAATAYGIRWILQTRNPISTALASPEALPMKLVQEPGNLAVWELDDNHIAPMSFSSSVQEAGSLAVWELDDNHTAPMSFSSSQPTRPLPIRYTSSGVRIDTHSLSGGGYVVVNVIHRPLLRAFADGVELPITTDEWNRLRIFLPSKTKELVVSYQPQWGLGFLFAGCLFLAALLIFYSGSTRQVGSRT